MILAIDPGNEVSGWAVMEGKDIVRCGISQNFDLLRDIATSKVDRHLCYEMMHNQGRRQVGSTTFDTVLWAGRFVQAHYPFKSTPVYRYQVKAHLCRTVATNDSKVMKAILDLYPATGGGKTPQVGTKKQPGPLYGVKSHIWAAIGVGLTAQGIR